MKNIIIVLSLFFFQLSTSVAQKNNFKIDINYETGGINRISNIKDKTGTNFIISSDGSQVPWQMQDQAWGLGRLKINGEPFAWSRRDSMYYSKNYDLIFEYRLPNINIKTKRFFDEKGYFVERYSFKNTTNYPVSLSDVAVFTPFNDNSPKDILSIEKRCHAHIWAGGNSSYVNAVKMLGEELYLGMVLTQGSITGYEISNRGWEYGGSDYRGTISLRMEDVWLKPGQSYQLEWKLFWNRGWQEFFKVAQSEGFVMAQAREYVVEEGDTVHITFANDQMSRNIQCQLNEVPINYTSTKYGIDIKYKASKEGENVIKLLYGNKITWVKVYVIPSIKELIRNRVEFIISKQQMMNKDDPRYGAYMVYDNETEQIYKNEDITAEVDRDEGAERLAMGVLIARYLQKYPNKVYLKSLLDYYNFVRNKLQTPDYKVFSDISQTGRNRCFNYGWVVEFYVELYKVTKDKQHILDAYHTMLRYFKDFGYDLVIFRIPVLDITNALEKNGFINEEKILLNEFNKYANSLVKYSKNLTKNSVEVNFGIGGISAIVMFLEEMYLLTNDNGYKNCIDYNIDAINRFGGEQPDYHLYNIGIRYWDGYCFGKYKTWGDTMPQWLTALSGYANFWYYRSTGKVEYLERAKMISRNNLSLFKPDGKAYCTFIYPDKINGRPGMFLDPFANDQDWALVYYTLINENW